MDSTRLITDARRNGVSKRWRTALIATVTIAGLALAGYLYSHRAKLTDKDTIVLSDFTNKTDSDFDQTLRQG
jgi:hypothetical protein